MTEILIALAPLLLLLTALLLGCYPGCEAIVRLSERLSAPTRQRARSRAQRRPHPPRSQVARGGLLLALALCGRAPPALSAP